MSIKSTDAALKIPFAVLGERLVHARDAVKGEAYSCPDPTCAGAVIPRQGEVYQWHYAHQFPCTSTGEGPIHAAAKRLVAQTINDHLDGLSVVPDLLPGHSSRSQSHDVCSLAECQPCRDVLWSKLVRADLEVTLPCGRTPDIWCGFAIEIRYSHAVDEEKAADYRRAGVTWIELDALPILDGEWMLLAWETEEQRRAKLRMQELRAAQERQWQKQTRMGQERSKSPSTGWERCPQCGKETMQHGRCRCGSVKFDSCPELAPRTPAEEADVSEEQYVAEMAVGTGSKDDQTKQTEEEDPLS